ncbi:hypothetical protein AB0K47_22050 [Streptomyces tirandamycinicus]|uniref:hypothetical protein n=1 Tax=Streptomyces TaxID=1883 RepID=UPI000381D70E|nr:hypothetical protein [Streptomyces sp. PKU-MA01144]NNJ02736.1 hypothetical protein [Streptomyces sp. PKU-MA01144]
MREDTRGCAGCLLAAGGAATALLAWAPLARVSIDGGVGQWHRDLSVLYVDLPLVALGGALLPLVVWAAALRWLHRPWLAAVAAVAGLALGVWVLTGWWVPYERPEFVH